MSWTVEVQRPAEKELAAIPLRARERIAEALRAMENNPLWAIIEFFFESIGRRSLCELQRLDIAEMFIDRSDSPFTQCFLYKEASHSGGVEFVTRAAYTRISQKKLDLFLGDQLKVPSITSPDVSTHLRPG